MVNVVVNCGYDFWGFDGNYGCLMAIMGLAIMGF